jgi:uncharacterized membrane protein
MDVLSAPAVRARAAAVSGHRTTLAIAVETWLPTALVGAATVASAVWIGAELLRRDMALATPAYDQAFFQQLVWNLDHGRWFVSSFNHNSFLGVHFEPLLVVPAALELVWPDPRLLTVINSVAVALVAPAVFLFLRAAFSPSRAGGYLAGALAAVMPFTPAMQEVARAGYHTETLAFPAVLLAGWAGLTRRPVQMWALAAIPLLAKEDQVYAVGVIALVVAARGRGVMRRHGLLLIGVTIAWGAALFLLIMPALRGGAVADTQNYYGWLGAFPTQLLAPIRQPGAFWIQLSNPAGWTAATLLVLSLGGLPLLRPSWSLLILPALAADLLSRHHPQPELHLQYALVVVAPTLAATAIGGRRALLLIARINHLRPRLRLRLRPVLVAVVVPGLALGGIAGSLPPARSASAAFARPAAWKELAAVTSVIPRNAAVASDDDAATWLASRAEVHVLPSLCDRCYVVIDRLGESPFISGAERTQLRIALPASRRLLADDGRFEVWSPVGE